MTHEVAATLALALKRTRPTPKVKSAQQSGHSGRGGSGSPERMHLRRSHIWGRIKRACDQWQFRPACLVNGKVGGPLVAPVYEVRANPKKAA